MLQQVTEDERATFGFFLTTGPSSDNLKQSLFLNVELVVLQKLFHVQDLTVDEPDFSFRLLAALLQLANVLEVVQDELLHLFADLLAQVIFGQQKCLDRVLAPHIRQHEIARQLEDS